MRTSVASMSLALGLWAVLTAVLGLRHPGFLAASAAAWAVGFVVAKSTVAPLDPTQAPFTPRVQLSYPEFDSWARSVVQFSLSRGHDGFWGRTDVHWTEKMGVLSAIHLAGMHVYAPAWIFLATVPLDLLLGWFAVSPAAAESIRAMQTRGPGGGIGASLVFGLVVGHLGGWAWGLFWRWLRAKWRGRAGGGEIRAPVPSAVAQRLRAGTGGCSTYRGMGDGDPDLTPGVPWGPELAVGRTTNE